MYTFVIVQYPGYKIECLGGRWAKKYLSYFYLLIELPVTSTWSLTRCDLTGCALTSTGQVLWVSAVTRHQLRTSSMLIDSSLVNPAPTVWNLGVFINANLVMRTHVARVIAQSFSVLRQIRQSLSSWTLETFVVTFVLSQLDYVNSVLTGQPGYLAKSLQSVHNATARLVCGVGRYDHI